MTNEEVCSHLHGLFLTNNKPSTPFLSTASQNPDISHELQQIASSLSSQNFIPYKALGSLQSASPSPTRPKLLHLLSGSDFVLTSPKRREKSEELKERSRKLAELAEKNAYKELARDIAPKKRETEESFSSYKDHIGFGNDSAYCWPMKNLFHLFLDILDGCDSGFLALPFDAVFYLLF